MADTPQGDEDHPNAKLLDVALLRTTLGYLGMGLPPVLLLGGCFIFREGLRDSLSSYYHSGMGDVFVGVLWVLGILLFAYKGYTRWDRYAGYAACVSAVGVAIFPTSTGSDSPGNGEIFSISTLHFICAAALFSTLIYFSGFSFTQKRKDKKPTKGKKRRNVVYVGCAIVMTGCMLLIGIYKIWFEGPPSSSPSSSGWFKPVFWLESIAVMVFGVSWFTKGESLLFRDKPGDEPKV